MADKKDKVLDASLDDEEKKEGDGEAPEGGDPLGEEPSGKKKKLFIIAAAVAVLLIGGGAGAYFMGFLDPLLGKASEGEHAAEEGAEGGEHGEGASPGGSVFLPIPDMIVNLSSTDGTPRYLRLKVQLQLKNDADKVRVEAVMPRVVDQFQTYLRELRVRDLRGSAGIYRLQMELLTRVNEAAYPVVVEDVLFQEILIQ